jgi:DNA invertase Pin-like site-specific DNA recombinase
MRRAVGYIRRSSGQDSPLSREAQAHAIASIAMTRGEAIAETFTDWGRSGSDRTRPEYLRMVAEVEAGRVSTVYAYDADRLARRTSTLALLLEAAAETGTAVIDRHGRDLAGRDRMTGEVMAALDSEMLRKMTERNRANAARRRARGDDMGPPPYGHVRSWTGERFEHVPTEDAALPLTAYVQAGSASGAARLLNEAGISCRRAKRWHPAQVHRFVWSVMPELLPPQDGRTRRAPFVVRILSGLLRCHCGIPGTLALCAALGAVWKLVL